MNMHYKQVMNSEYLYEDLLKKIIDLEYKPGEGISENELCEVYGTTRHTVRGALSVLKEKGLIEVIPQKGTYVTLIDLKLIDDILFLRAAVEQETLHAIFKMKDRKELVQRLRDCQKRQESLGTGRQNSSEFYQLDDEFHGIMLSSVGREHVQSLYEDAYLHVRRWRNMEVGALERLANLPTEHKKIIDAIEQDNESEARRCMNYHIDSVGQFGDELRNKYPDYFADL